QGAERPEDELHLRRRGEDENDAQDNESADEIGAEAEEGVVVLAARFGDGDTQVPAARGTLDDDVTDEGDQRLAVGTLDLGQRAVGGTGKLGDGQLLVPQRA